MLATVTWAARGLSGHDLRLWVYAVSFRQGVLPVLDLAFVADCFPPRRRCGIEGAILDELLVSAFLAPLLDADLRAQPHFHLCATDGSPSGAGACSTPMSLELGTLLFLRLFGRERLLGKARLEYGFDAPRRNFEIRERPASSLNISTFLNWKPSSASFGGWWTVVSEIVVCFVWSTVESFLDQCARGAPAVDV